jgi:hypothetical protein
MLRLKKQKQKTAGPSNLIPCFSLAIAVYALNESDPTNPPSANPYSRGIMPWIRLSHVITLCKTLIMYMHIHTKESHQ